MNRLLTWIIDAANNNSYECAFLLGFLYEHGLSVSQSYSDAAYWYKRAAEGGIAAAQYALAVLFESGQGVDKSPLQAYRYALLAAKQGIPAAQFLIGSYLLYGIGVAPDVAQARKWLERAEKVGSRDAKSLLACALEEGLFGTPEKSISLRHYNELADEENPHALFMLASRLAHGDGCEKDDEQALNLYIKASELGSHAAAFTLAMIYGKGLLGVTPNQEKSNYYFELRETLYKQANSQDSSN